MAHGAGEGGAPNTHKVGEPHSPLSFSSLRPHPKLSQGGPRGRRCPQGHLCASRAEAPDGPLGCTSGVSEVWEPPEPRPTEGRLELAGPPAELAACRLQSSVFQGPGDDPGSLDVSVKCLGRDEKPLGT